MIGQFTVASGNIVSAAATASARITNPTLRSDITHQGEGAGDAKGPNDDLELMRRVAQGDRGAQRQVVRRLLRRVERLCRALLRNRDDALDARQLSLVAILKSAHTFRGTSALERWADRITVRTTLRAAVSERRARQAPVVDVERSLTQPTTENELLAYEYLGWLSERQRAVVVMRHGFDFAIEDIAEAMGISKNSVKDRLTRARGTLRRMCRCERALMDVPSSEVVG